MSCLPSALATTLRIGGALLVMVSVIAACGGSRLDRAGGERPVRPHVLRMANGNGTPAELQVFADAVARLSHGRLRIAFRNAWRKDRVAYEPELIADVEAGRADLGWTGTRAWDAVGVTSFDALHMPLLVDSYPLEQRVLESALPREMLAALAPIDLVGLGVLPGPLRRPLGADRPLLAPADFRGLQVGIGDGRVPRATLAALGARPRAIPSGGSIAALDGVEVQVAAIERDNYVAHAAYLAANVDLWPRPAVVFMGAKRFAALRASERDVLRRAAAAAIRPMLAEIGRDERRAAVALCGRGLRLVRATPADLALLRRAVAPVYVAAPDATRRRVAAITAMRREVGAAPGALPACPRPATDVATAIPSGAYAVTITRADARRAAMAPGDVLGGLARERFRLVFDNDRFALYEGGPTGTGNTIGFAGTYSTFRGRVVLMGTNGDRVDARWSAAGDGVRFTDVKLEGEGGPNPYAVVWGSHKWTRIGP